MNKSSRGTHLSSSRYHIFQTDLVYRSAIYPQGRTFECGLGGRLGVGIQQTPVLTYSMSETVRGCQYIELAIRLW